MTSPDNSTHQAPETLAWAHQEEGNNVILGNREGLLALRAAIDVALENREASIEEPEVEFSHIRLTPDAQPFSPTSNTNDKLALAGCLITLGLMFIIFVIGCLTVIQHLL